MAFTPRPPRPFNVPGTVNLNPPPQVPQEQRWYPGVDQGKAKTFGSETPMPPGQVPSIPYRNLRTGRADGT